jgi:hypothetical protein
MLCYENRTEVSSTTRKEGRRAVHEPNLATILMVERAIHKAKDYPTKMELWRSLPRRVQYQTFNRIIEYLLSSNKIILNDRQIVWVFPDNPKLRKMLSTGTRVR